MYIGLCYRPSWLGDRRERFHGTTFRFLYAFHDYYSPTMSSSLFRAVHNQQETNQTTTDYKHNQMCQDRNKYNHPLLPQHTMYPIKGISEIETFTFMSLKVYTLNYQIPVRITQKGVPVVLATHSLNLFINFTVGYKILGRIIFIIIKNQIHFNFQDTQKHKFYQNIPFGYPNFKLNIFINGINFFKLLPIKITITHNTIICRIMISIYYKNK